MNYDNLNSPKGADEGSDTKGPKDFHFTPPPPFNLASPGVPINGSLVASHQNSQPSLGTHQEEEEEGRREGNSDAPVPPTPAGQPQQEAQENEFPMKEGQDNSELQMGLSDQPPPPPPSYEKVIEGQMNEVEEPIKNEPPSPPPPQYEDAADKEQPLGIEREDDDDEPQLPPPQFPAVPPQEDNSKKPFEPPKFEAPLPPPQFGDFADKEQPLKKEEGEDKPQPPPPQFSPVPPQEDDSKKPFEPPKFEASPPGYKDIIEDNQEDKMKEDEKEIKQPALEEPPSYLSVLGDTKPPKSDDKGDEEKRDKGSEPPKFEAPPPPPQFGDAADKEQPLKYEEGEDKPQPPPPQFSPVPPQEDDSKKPFEPPRFEAPPSGYKGVINNDQPPQYEEGGNEPPAPQFPAVPPQEDDSKKLFELPKFEAPPSGYKGVINNDQPPKYEEGGNEQSGFQVQPQISTLEVRGNDSIRFDAPPPQQPQEQPPPYGAVNPPQGDDDHKAPQETGEEKKVNEDEANAYRANEIISFFKQYTDKFSSFRSVAQVQQWGTTLWNFVGKSIMLQENEKTKERIKAEYDKIMNQYVSTLEETQKEAIAEIMEDIQTDFIHEVVLQKMLKIEAQTEVESESEYETIQPDQLFEKIVANIGNIPLSSITQLAQEDWDNFVTMTPQLVAQNLSDIELGDEDDDDNINGWSSSGNDYGNGSTQIKELTKEELKLEEFLGCVNNVLEKAKEVKILQIKKLVIYNALFKHYFVQGKEEIDSKIFETGESIMANAFNPKEGLEPFYTYFIRNNILMSLSLIDKEVPPNTPENESIKKLFWDVVGLIHQKQNSKGMFKYFRIVKPKELSNLSLQEFTAKINADLETFLDVKFNYSVVPFEYNKKEMMIYATNDPSIYNRIPGFPLLIDDVLCRVELCDSFYLKADSLDFSSLMYILSRYNMPEVDVEYIVTKDQKYFLIVFPAKELVDLFTEKRGSFIQNQSEVAPNVENDNINKTIQKITETTTNTRVLLPESLIRKIGDVGSISSLSSCWDTELWKRHYTRVHPGDEEYKRKLRVFAAAYGNIIFEKGYYKTIPRNNPSDLSLFAIKSETQNIHLSNIMRLIDGYMICEKRAEFPSFEGVEVLTKGEEGSAPTLDFLLQKVSVFSDPKRCAYVLLLSGKESFVNGWKAGAWGGECGDEVELLYRTTLQRFLDKKVGIKSLFYEGTNTVYFRNVVVYRAGIGEGFAMYERMAKVNVVLGLMPEGKGDEDEKEVVKEAWRNVIGTAVEFGAKSIVVGGKKENEDVVRDILASK